MGHEQLPDAGIARDRQYLTFLLGGERYAMPTGHVREVIGVPALTPVPLMPDFFRGLVNVRGAVVPVIDLSLRLGLPATVLGRRTCVVLLELEHGERAFPVGVLVDAVYAVLGLAPGQIERPSAFGGRIRSEFIGDMLELDGRLVASLDLRRVLALRELAELAGAAGPGSPPPASGGRGGDP